MTSLPTVVPLTEESEVQEFMASVDVPRVARTACAFLNGEGGRVVVGVAEDGHAVGVEDAAAAADRLWDALATLIVPTPPLSVDVVTLGVDGPPGVVVDVPAGTRPPYLVEGTVYRRDGSRNRVADASDLRGMIDESREQEGRWEIRPALGVGMADLDTLEINRTRLARYQRGMNQDVLASETDGVMLERMGLVVRGRPSNGAAVLFGTPEVLRVSYPQAVVRLTRFGDDTRTFLDDQTLHGHAFWLFNRALSFVEAQLPRRGYIAPGGLVREERTAVPFAVLREALLNAFVHREYASYGGSVAVAVHGDRVEIWNAGDLPEGMTMGDLRTSHVSRPRNPTMAQVFRMRGLVELLGTGTARMIEGCREAGLPEPVWERAGGGIRLTLRFVAAAGPPPDINPRMAALLRALSDGETITLADYAERFASAVSERSARSDLAHLTKLGLLYREGQARHTLYVRSGLPYDER